MNSETAVIYTETKESAETLQNNIVKPVLESGTVIEGSIPKKSDSISDVLRGDYFKQQVALALPSLLTPERFMRIAITTFNKIPKLAECDKLSFINSLLTLAQLGLEPDGRLAHLIPYKNNKQGTTECQLIIDYKGMAVLIQRSGRVSYMHSDVVCENDEFAFNLGHISYHRINYKEPRGDVYAAYTVFKMKDGGEKHEVMSLEELNKIRARSKTSNYGPWVTDLNEMYKKTVFKRAAKLLDWSAEVKEAIDKDDDGYESTESASPKTNAADMLANALGKSKVDALTGEVING